MLSCVNCRCRQCVINCRTKSMDDKTVEQLHTNYRLCSKHFEDSQFMNSGQNSLIWSAVPNVFDAPNPPKRLQSRRRIQRVSRDSDDSVAETPTDTANLQTALLFHTYAAPGSNHDILTARASKITDQSPRKIILRQKLDHTKKQLRRARVTLSRIRKHKKTPLTTVAKNSCVRCGRSNQLPKAQQKFIEMQLDATWRNSRGMRFDKTSKMLALEIYYKKPAAYRFLSNQFNLPSKRTLQSFIGTMAVDTGFKTDFVEALRQRAKSLSAEID